MELLRWLAHDHFTFLGYRERQAGGGVLIKYPTSYWIDKKMVFIFMGDTANPDDIFDLAHNRTPCTTCSS